MTSSYSEADRAVDLRKFLFANKTRIVILFLSLVCLSNLQANTITLNFTVICMNDVIEEQKANSTEPHWLENQGDISLAFSSVAFGAIAGTLPIVPLFDRFGVRYIFTIYGLVSAVGTLAMPFCVSIGFYAVLFARMLQGAGFSVLFSAMGAIAERWSVLAELSTYIAILSSSLQMSSIVTMPLAGVLCESSLGWRALYYFLGTFTLLSQIVFFFFYQDQPGLHRNVSHKEVRKISIGKAPTTKTGVPYKAMCQNKVVLGIWLSAIGGNLGFMMLLQYGPTYLNKVLQLDVRETGFATALPFVLAALVKFVAGPVSDNAVCVSERVRVIMFATASQGALAVGYVVMALTTSREVAQISYTASIVMSSINIVGVYKCAQMVARQHVHFVFAVISFTACFNTLLLPLAVGFACPDNTSEQWSRLLIGIAIITVITNIPFPFVATVEPADFTKTRV
ncbi:unnamed protein product [Caenorhabditis auriculariae]|uniref:Major facilitator superfamily (MFS) profile domain-containing protein n=1 Tax=Caenorhabditis auriculariae TaxID=2777116 RepID=A0A8S1H8K0_9PELO|nr:unnamed protein product [Caenorhabditis auriculariae]